MATLFAAQFIPSSCPRRRNNIRFHARYFLAPFPPRFSDPIPYLLVRKSFTRRYVDRFDSTSSSFARSKATLLLRGTNEEKVLFRGEGDVCTSRIKSRRWKLALFVDLNGHVQTMQTYGRDLYMNLTGEAKVAGINPIRSRGRGDRFISVEEHWSIRVLEISLSSTLF